MIHTFASSRDFSSTTPPHYAVRGGARWAFLSLGLSLFLSAPVHAGFVVMSGNNPQTDENVLLNNNQVGMTISGTLNQSGDVVTFTSPSQFLAGPSNGQARVEARSANDINSSQVDISDSITVAFQNANTRFGSLIFNAFAGNGSLTVAISGVNADNTPANAVIALDTNNNPLSVGNGSNFYTVVASGGMLMTSVAIQTNANTTYTDLRQIRIGGVVPEPGTAISSAIACCLASAARGKRRR